MFRRRGNKAIQQPDTGESGFGRVGHTPLVFLSFYLDLPIDAGISEGHGFNAIEFSEPLLEDWSGFDLQGFLGMPPLPEPAVRPCTTLRFQRVTNEVPPPFANVEKAFGSLFPIDLPAAEELPSFLESRSVVMAIRIVPRKSTEFGNEWLHEQFASVLSTLNDKLLALGAAADDHTIGPITERQLPPAVLGFQGDMRNVQGGRVRKLVTFTLLLHQGRGARVEDHDASVINYALAIADRAGQGPLFPAMEFSFAARRSFDMGLFSQAVLETGTAIELLVNRVVLGIELEKGSSQERIDKLLENTGFQNLIKYYLAKRLGVTLDKQLSGSDPLSNWLRVAYKLRNRVAHTGHKPTVAETIEAMRLASELIHFVASTAEQSGGFGITFPSFDDLRPSPMLDERSLATEDESSTSLARRDAFWRGRDAARSGDTEAAKLAFIEADEMGSAGGAYNLAVLYLADDEDEAAGIAALRRASERGHPVAPAYLGVYLLKEGNEAEAEQFFLEAPEHYPGGGPLAAYFLGVIASGRGELVEAADFYKRASVFDEDTLAGEAAFRRGNILQDLGDSDAVEAYTRGAELGSAKAASNLANLLRGRGDIVGAIATYERALTLSDPDTEGQIAFNLAKMLDELDRASDAKPVYERASTLGEPWSLVRLAGMAAEANDVGAAQEHLSAARAVEDPAVRAAAEELATQFQVDVEGQGQTS
jgi:tetratricopeptide (TPR) repeat protein